MTILIERFTAVPKSIGWIAKVKQSRGVLADAVQLWGSVGQAQVISHPACWALLLACAGLWGEVSGERWAQDAEGRSS
jgi:hypothetical protein